MDGRDFSLGISLISDVRRLFLMAKFEYWRLGEGDLRDRTPEDPENGDAMKSELGNYGKPTILTVGVCKCKQGNEKYANSGVGLPRNRSLMQNARRPSEVERDCQPKLAMALRAFGYSTAACIVLKKSIYDTYIYI